jgi:signal transduction histidine kinase
MPFARLSRLARSLRFRLTAWNTGAILLLTVATLVGVREGLRLTLMGELDQRLVEDGEEVRLLLERFGPEANASTNALTRMALVREPSGWFVQVFDAAGRPVRGFGAVPEGDGPAPGSVGRPVVSVGGRRLLERQVHGPGGDWLARVGCTPAEVQEDMARLTQMLLVAVAALVVAAPVGGYWLAGRATRPLAQIIQTTAGLEPSRLADRLPIRGSGNELDQLSATINGLLDRIASYVARKRDFLANAAHELRSPLAAILSSVEVALQADRSTEEYKDLLADLVEECTGLGTLVNQLLLLAESEAGRLKGTDQAQRLDRLASRAVEMFQGAAESHGLALELTAADPALTPGDATHLRQLLHNLIDNAIKFTPPGGRVAVSVRCEAAAGLAVLQVADTGSGIAADDLPHVFERFYRADKSRPREAGTRGSGLGLTICQAIVTDSGGTIDLRSPPGQGTCVTVRLPLAPPARPSAEAAPKMSDG